MPGRIWAGSPAGSGRGLYRALDIAPRFPYSAQERRCLWGGPAMLLMHFSFVSVFPVDSGRCPVPRRHGEGPGRGREDAAAPEHLTGDDMTRTFLALIFLLLTAVACPAGQHPLTETRTADDFYAAFDRDILIKTKFCSVRAFQEKALLRSDLFGELVFTALFAPMPESLKHYRPQHRHFLLDESRVSGDKLDKRLILSEFPQGRWLNGHQYAV